MAEKGFGVKEINFCGSTPKITSLSNINLNAVNVAISTNATIGGTLSVTGNVSVGGVLTYEDVTNIDSVGLITARSGIDCNGDIDVDGHTNLDNVSIAGVTTFGNNITASGTSRFEIASMENGVLDGEISHNGDTDTKIKFPSNDNISFDTGGTTRLNISNSGVTVTGTVTSDGFVGNATKITLTSSTTNSSLPVLFSTGVTGSSGADTLINSSKLTFNPSSGTLSATIFSGSGASLTNLPAANLTGTLPAISGANLTGIAVTEAPVVDYTITANGSSAYRFHGGGVDETADDPDLYLIRGQKYRFNNTTGSSHPFEFRDGTGADSSTYSNGVTGDDEGVQFFTVPYDAPAKIFYRCTIHSGMVGNIYIRGANGQNDNVGITTFSGDINVSSGQMSVTTPEYLRVAHTNASHNQSLSDNATVSVRFGSVYDDTKSGWTGGAGNYYAIQKTGHFLVTAQAVITSNTASSLRDWALGVEMSTDSGGSWSLIQNAGGRGGGNDNTDTDTVTPVVTLILNFTAGTRLRVRAYANTDGGDWQVDEDLGDTQGSTDYGGSGFDNQKGTRLHIIRLF